MKTLSKRASSPAQPKANPLLAAVELHQQGRLTEAEDLFRRILQVAPDNATALYSLAVILHNTGRPHEALETARRGVQASPTFAPLCFIQGAILQSLHQFEEALAAFDRAIEVDPASTEALLNSGVLLHDMHRHKDALIRFQRLLEIDPNHQTALGNCGILLTEFKMGPQAVAMFERLLALNPDYPYGLGLLLYERMHHCDWTDLHAVTERITQGLREGRRTCKTLAYMALSDDARDHLTCARIFADLFSPRAGMTPEPLWRGETYHHARTRIAYVSPDLREHPVGHLMAGVIEAHDKTRFETIAISLGIHDGSRIRARMEAAFDHFIDARDMSPRQIAELMRRLEVDIAIDLAGYTTDSRTAIFTHRPAPIQVNYLGYPGTLGLDCFDYILADRTVIPESQAACFTETPAYVEGCYLPLPAGVEVAKPKKRKDYGLPEKGFVFCAFSHDYKIHPDVFEVWMRLLASNPGSVLWLVSRNELSQANLRREAEARGVDGSRLVFAGRVPAVEDHMARYRVADLFLDTWPYNAHTTAADALMAGLPVVTYQGGAFPARVASSLLATFGLPELVTHSLDDYFALADGFAKHPRRLAKFRKRLSPEVLATHPFLGEGFTRDLEAALARLTPRIQPSRPQAEAPAPCPAPLDGPDTDPSLSQARELVHQGNLPQAEIHLRHSLAQSAPGTALRAAGEALLADLARGYGLPEGFELSERAPRDRRTRYLVIKAWGYGFWSEGHHLAGQLLLAELTGRTPIILWGTNCLFRGPGDVDASPRFFQPISPATLEDLPAQASFYPPKWNATNLLEENLNKWDGEGSRLAAQYTFARTEEVVVSDFFSTVASILPWIGPTSRYHGWTEDAVYREMFRKYLRPTADLQARADAFQAEAMAGRPWVGVHVRGSDKVLESPNLARTNAAYFDFVDRIVELNPSIGIFLMTDTSTMVEAFRSRYGDRILCTDAVRTASNVGVHLSGQDGVALGEEVYLDTLVALKCDYFVGNQESNVSAATASLKAWPAGFLFLLGDKDIRSENLFLHHRTPVAKPTCRLCGQPVAPKFSLPVLGRHRVAYAQCTGCGSLQTEAPHWLDEAYAKRPERFDTGKASRTLSNFLIVPRFLEVLGLRPEDRCADFGGGTGLFARLMRDRGWNYFSYDKYGSGEFCDGFAWESFDRPLKLVTIFECAEHFADPATEWATLLATGADFVLGSTGLYVGQGPDWSYLVPESGQHVFFYSPQALAHLAALHGRHAYLLGGYFLLTRQPLTAEQVTALAQASADLGTTAQAGLQQWAQRPFEQATRDLGRLTARERLKATGRRIALDGTFFRFATGISRLWKSLLAEWSANGFGQHLLVLDRGRTAPRFAGIAVRDLPMHDYGDLEADRAMLQAVCDQERIGLFTSTYYTTPLTTPAALMVPDMIPEVMDFDLSDAQWQEKHHAIRYARHFLAISDSTNADLRRFFPDIAPERVVTARCGTDFRPPHPGAVEAFRARYGIERPYFLISGVKGGYKNVLLFFQAFARLGDRRRDFAIVCTNSHPVLEPEFAACVGDAHTHLLILSDEDLQCAFAGATALVFPSRYEGFGLPVLEAMACGCPVITCRHSSLVEVAGEAALFIDPDDPAALEATLWAVQDPVLRESLIQKGFEQARRFTWRAMADTVEDALVRWALES